MPADVLRVSSGQDHGARFGLRGSEATVGRGPVMDIVLTDPRVSRRHARVAVEGGALVVEDLGSALGTTVNGIPIRGVTAVAPGDRIGLGGTEMTVVWTPGGALAPAEPPPPPPPPPSSPPPAPSAAEAVAAPPPAPVARAGVLLPLAALALAAFSLAGVAMPVVGDASGTDSLWTLGPRGFRVHGLLAALLAAGTAGGWLVAATLPRMARHRVPLAAATAIGGGLIAGLPLFLAAVDLQGVGTEAGLVLLALAGCGVAGCAVAGVADATAGADPPAADGWEGSALLAAGGGAGGALALVAAPLTWISTPGRELGGFDDGFRAGGWLVPLALAVAAASALTLAVVRSGEPRAAMCVATGAGALAGVALGFVDGAAIGFGEFRTGIGLSLAMTGAGLALASIVIGGATMAARWTPPGGAPPRGRSTR